MTVISAETKDVGNGTLVTPLPILQVFCICMVQMSEAMNVDLLFPFLAFMVEDMGYTGEALGYHAGILAASFCGAQFCTSVAWGVISDRYGRKAAIVAGTLGSGLGMLIFGFAKTFPQAILGRIVGGLLCGNLGVVKSFLTEITDDTNRSPAFYWFSLSWAVGSVFAPLLGGMLCKPSEKFPTVFSSSPHSLFVEFPYLLPCLFTVGVTVVSSLLCWVCMIETVGATKEQIQARIAGKSTAYGSNNRDSGVHGLQMVPVGSSSTTGDGELSPKNSGEYARLPIDPVGDLEYEEDEDDYSADTVNALHKLETDVEGGGSRSGTGKNLGSQLDTVFEDQPVEVIPPVALEAITTAGVSTALQQPQGRMRNRSRSSSSTMPYTAVAADPEPSSISVATAPPQGRIRNRSRSSSNTASFIDLEQAGSTSIVFRPRVGSAASQTEAYPDPDIYIPNIAVHSEIETSQLDDGAAITEMPGNTGVAEEDNANEEICWPWVFEFAAQVGRYLNCMSRTTTASALDGSVHSSQQLLGASSKAHKSSVLVQRVVVLATLNYGMICASSILMDETLPLYLKLDAKQGGFGFNSSQIGMLLSTGAAGMMLLTVLCMPLTMGVSNKWISFQSLAWSIPVELAFPLIALLNNEVLCDIHSRTERVWLLWPLLMIVNIVKNYFNCLSFTSAIMMVNHSVTDEYLGAVNGLGQSLGALARCLGPAVGGLLWSMGTRYNFVWLNFIFITLLYLLNMYVSDLVPKSLDYKKKFRVAVKQS